MDHKFLPYKKAVGHIYFIIYIYNICCRESQDFVFDGLIQISDPRLGHGRINKGNKVNF